MATTGNEIEPSAADHVVINIQDHVPNQQISVDAVLNRWEKYVGMVKIPRVPKRLRLGEDDAYEPKIISFGPYHRSKDEVKHMEEHKQWYLQAIVSRCRGLHGKLKNKIKELEGDVRRCYFKDIGQLDEENGEFHNMMMLDGCFIVEYLIRCKFGKKVLLADRNTIGVRTLLHNDMLLLENQLPFFFLEKIFDHVKEHQQQLSEFTFMELCINFLKFMVGKDISLRFTQRPRPAHLLHLYYSTYRAADIGKDAKRKKEIVPHRIPSATVLHEHGISFKKNEAKECSIIDIKFNKVKGVLEIPPLLVDDSTASQFRNIIAFEQLYPSARKSNEPGQDPSEVLRVSYNFSMYAVFMDHIVNTSEDVALLYRKGILEHRLGSDKDVADLFNKLNRGTFTRHPNHYLCEQYKDVMDYKNRFWPRWRANLMRNYLNTPWAGISVAAAAILLFLTVIQTVFTGTSTF